MTYKEIIQTPGRRIKKEVYYIDSNEERVDLALEDVKSVKLGFNAPVIGTLIKYSELVLKEQIPLGSTIYIKVIASYENESQYITYGPYYLRQEATYNADEKTYSHECYDEMMLTMVEYDLRDESGEIQPRLDIEFPCLVADYFDALVESLGLENGIDNLVNGERVMNSDIYTGINYTCRDVLNDLAQANGILLTIQNNEISTYEFGTESPIVIDDDILKNSNIDFGQSFGPVNTIVLSRSGGSDNIYYPDPLPEEPYEFKIIDNQLMNGNDRSDYLEGIYEKLNGIEYNIFDTELVGYGGFTPLQKVQFETNNNTYNSYVFNWENDLEDGYKEVIYTEPPEESVTDYSKADSTDRRINQAYIIVDKQNQIIESVITRTEQLEESIERLATSLDSNVVIVPVDSSNKPLEDANYDINYTVKFLSEPITLQPTTESSHTGITCTIDNTKIRFTVDSDTPISTLDNKYTFTWTYTQDDETYTSIKSIVVSLAPQGNAGVIQSDEEPTETNVLWYNTQTNKLYRYTTDGGWGEVNDYSNEITYLSDGITQLNNDLEDKISETNNNILQLQETMETNFTQTESTFNFQFDTLQNIVNSNKTDVDTELNRWSQYIRFEEGNIILGESGNEYTLKIENDRIAIYYNGNNISSWIQDTFNVGRINIGNFTFIPRANGSLSIRKRGDI